MILFPYMGLASCDHITRCKANASPLLTFSFFIHADIKNILMLHLHVGDLTWKALS